MTKLKTLKDLKPCMDGEYHDSLCVLRSELKAEAIKWVKFGYHKNKEGKWIKWKEMFKEFFNITEENLK